MLSCNKKSNIFHIPAGKITMAETRPSSIVPIVTLEGFVVSL